MAFSHYIRLQAKDMKTNSLILIVLIMAVVLLVPKPYGNPYAILDESPRTIESSIDAKIFRYCNGSIVNPVLDWLMPFMTEFRRWRVFLILVWCWLVLFGKTKGRWAAFMLIPLVAASDQLTASVLKPLTERMRPCEVLGNVHFWYGENGWIWTPAEVVGGFKTSFSFPSTHASNITASMLFLSLVYRRWLPYICLSIAVLVSFSRIYNGVHWPSDVLGGMLTGAALAWAAYEIFKRVYKEKKEEEKPKTSEAESEGDATLR